jgi:ribose transport system substrate-binding protein
MAASLCPDISHGQDGSPGLTTPVALPPFNPNAEKCNAPPGLERALTFAQDNEREFMQGVSRGLAAAAKDRGLAFKVVVAQNDPIRMIE